MRSLRRFLSRSLERLYPRRRIHRLEQRIEELQAWLVPYHRGWPPGHFYSPIPSLEEVNRREAELFAPPSGELPGIDLNEWGQLSLLHELSRYYNEQPFRSIRSRDRRYHFENDYFTYGEALVLYAMIRHAQPQRVIEVGSGFSSAALLDINDLFFDRSIRLTFIEPFPERLRSLAGRRSEGKFQLLEQKVQDVDPALFDELASGDVLFIDSTHVCKIGSDVQVLFNEVLPRLGDGVLIHFHDIYYPFEYPRPWILEGRAWNEAYVLRAFLQMNRRFRIALFNSYLAAFHADAFEKGMPLAARGFGSSLWLRVGENPDGGI